MRRISWFGAAVVWLCLFAIAAPPIRAQVNNSAIERLVACPAGGNDGATNLLAHMNGANAGTTFIDSSIAANTLTAVNATTSTARSKWFDSSGSFNGTNAFVKTSGTSWTFAGDFTLEAWIFQTSQGAVQVILGTNTDATNDWEFSINASNQIQFVAGTVTHSTGTISANTWTHVAAVRSSGTLKLYINGVNDGSGTPTLTSNGAFLSIGARGDVASPIQFFTGNMQEVRVSSTLARWTANFVPPTFPYC
jgi:hypothetical protein